MGIPKNLIRENLYSQGDKLIDPETGQQYVGSYCEVNGLFFKGKTFNGKNLALKISKISEIPKRFSPNRILNKKLNKLLQNTLEKIQSRIFKPTKEEIQRGYSERYFIKKINSNPIFIKEVDEVTFYSAQTDSSYQTLSLKYYFTNINEGKFLQEDIDNADKKMAGIKIFLQD